MTESFQFNACDTLAARSGGPVCSTDARDHHGSHRYAAVIQPFSEKVTGGQLVLSCNSPANYITPTGQNQSPAPTGSNPLLQCPEFQFPPITLDGLEQTVTGSTASAGGNPVAGESRDDLHLGQPRQPHGHLDPDGDLRPDGDRYVGATVERTPTRACLGVDAFCNSSIGAAAGNTATNGAHDGQIAPNYLQVGSIQCLPDSSGGTNGYNPPNLNPPASNTAGGNFGAPGHPLRRRSGTERRDVPLQRDLLTDDS